MICTTFALVATATIRSDVDAVAVSASPGAYGWADEVAEVETLPLQNHICDNALLAVAA
ncbi:hypothetical protein ACFYU5_08550 [Nocardia aobensis]|uniref:Uncharacterized protein n=1 Tax=Nocardia aobensis TaxID=257277 RepID=A0ABW6NZ87_9NOCA